MVALNVKLEMTMSVLTKPMLSRIKELLQHAKVVIGNDTNSDISNRIYSLKIKNVAR